MTIALWSSDDWRREAEAWLDGQLAARGIRRTGEVTQPHLRPWATVLRAPTTRGVVWLKAAGAEARVDTTLDSDREALITELRAEREQHARDVEAALAAEEAGEVVSDEIVPGIKDPFKH